MLLFLPEQELFHDRFANNTLYLAFHNAASFDRYFRNLHLYIFLKAGKVLTD